MQSKVIITEILDNLKNFEKVQEDLNAWLNENPDVEIVESAQSVVEKQLVITTIFYK